MLTTDLSLSKTSTPLIKYFDIKPFCTTIKNPQANALVERVHQVIYNILVTKDLDNKVFDYIDAWDETLSYIAWEMRASYHHTIGKTSAQAVFGRDMILNLAPDVDRQVITANKQWQVNIDNAVEKIETSQF